MKRAILIDQGLNVCIVSGDRSEIRLAIATDGKPNGTAVYLKMSEAKKIANALMAAINSEMKP